jgi:ABC-2 type transport system ATP-binding protein
MAAVEISQLVVRYGEKVAVDGLDFIALQGQITALLGPNGAGKTSTIEVSCGLREPTEGSVRLFSQNPQAPDIRSQMGVMLQSGGLYPTARPLEWLTYLAKLYPQADDPATLLEMVGIDPTIRTQTRRLSGGEQQRVKLAAALLPRPKLLFLDEPTAGLDALARRNLLDLLRQQRDDGVAIVLTTHLLADVEDLADTITLMSQGKVAMTGTLAELTGTMDAISFGGPQSLPLAGLSATLPQGYSANESQPGKYVVTGKPSPEIMSIIAIWCSTQGVMATELGVGNKTLEQLLIDVSSEAVR